MRRTSKLHTERSWDLNRQLLAVRRELTATFIILLLLFTNCSGVWLSVCTFLNSWKMDFPEEVLPKGIAKWSVTGLHQHLFGVNRLMEQLDELRSFRSATLPPAQVSHFPTQPDREDRWLAGCSMWSPLLHSQEDSEFYGLDLKTNKHIFGFVPHCCLHLPPADWSAVLLANK